jgi:hypothetical protein
MLPLGNTLLRPQDHFHLQEAPQPFHFVEVNACLTDDIDMPPLAHFAIDAERPRQETTQLFRPLSGNQRVV